MLARSQDCERGRKEKKERERGKKEKEEKRRKKKKGKRNNLQFGLLPLRHVFAYQRRRNYAVRRLVGILFDLVCVSNHGSGREDEQIKHMYEIKILITTVEQLPLGQIHDLVILYTNNNIQHTKAHNIQQHTSYNIQHTTTYNNI